MVNMVVNHPAIGSYDLSGVRSIFYGASPMPEAVVRLNHATLAPCRTDQLYGQTEASPCITYNPPECHVLEGKNAARLKAAGRAMYAAEVVIVDAEDREVPRGTVGEVCARGPVVMLGDWNKPEQTAQALRGGWLHTGDGG